MTMPSDCVSLYCTNCEILRTGTQQINLNDSGVRSLYSGTGQKCCSFSANCTQVSMSGGKSKTFSCVGFSAYQVSAAACIPMQACYGNRLWIAAIGGGGGGGGGSGRVSYSGYTYGGGGGGAGATIIRVVCNIPCGTFFCYCIGSGGAGGSARDGEFTGGSGGSAGNPTWIYMCTPSTSTCCLLMCAGGGLGGSVSTSSSAAGGCGGYACHPSCCYVAGIGPLKVYNYGGVASPGSTCGGLGGKSMAFEQSPSITYQPLCTNGYGYSYAQNTGVAPTAAPDPGGGGAGGGTSQSDVYNYTNMYAAAGRAGGIYIWWGYHYGCLFAQP